MKEQTMKETTLKVKNQTTTCHTRKEREDYYDTNYI